MRTQGYQTVIVLIFIVIAFVALGLIGARVIPTWLPPNQPTPTPMPSIVQPLPSLSPAPTIDPLDKTTYLEHIFQSYDGLLLEYQNQYYRVGEAIDIQPHSLPIMVIKTKTRLAQP